MAKYSCEICGCPIEKRLDVRYEFDTIHCKQCYQTEESAEYIAKKKSGETNLAQKKPTAVETGESEPFLSGVLWILAVLSLIGGVIVAFVAWPEASSFGGEAPFPAASIGAIVSGVVYAVVFFALGQILSVVSRVERKIDNRDS